jgi:hypothetical protein
MSVGRQAPGMGRLTHAVRSAQAQRELPRDLVRDEINGHYRRSRRRLLRYQQKSGPSLQYQMLAWLRDHVDPRIPRLWYTVALGHDLHVATFAALFVQHYHATEPDPFTGKLGWLENVGLVSTGKVTTAFRDFEVDQLIAESALYGDFKYHEVGTGSTAEANTQSALTTPTGIARVAGTQVEAAADMYQSVATVTADTAETWTEHGLFNQAAAGTMMDRSLIVPTVAVVPSDTVTFTYSLQKQAEP